MDILVGTFKFGNDEITLRGTIDDVYLKAADVCKSLGYTEKSSNNAIKRSVSAHNVFPLSELAIKYPNPPFASDKAKTKYINQAGLMEVVHRCRLPNAIPFKLEIERYLANLTKLAFANLKSQLTLARQEHQTQLALTKQEHQTELTLVHQKHQAQLALTEKSHAEMMDKYVVELATVKVESKELLDKLEFATTSKKSKSNKRLEFDAIISELKPLYDEALKWQYKTEHASNKQRRRENESKLREAHYQLEQYTGELNRRRFFEDFRKELDNYYPKFWQSYSGTLFNEPISCQMW